MQVVVRLERQIRRQIERESADTQQALDDLTDMMREQNRDNQDPARRSCNASHDRSVWFLTASVLA